MNTITLDSDRLRHRLATRTKDIRVSITACGRRTVQTTPCPTTPEHRIALPDCTHHLNAKGNCEVCFG